MVNVHVMRGRFATSHYNRFPPSTFERGCNIVHVFHMGTCREFFRLYGDALITKSVLMQIWLNRWLRNCLESQGQVHRPERVNQWTCPCDPNISYIEKHFSVCRNENVINDVRIRVAAYEDSVCWYREIVETAKYKVWKTNLLLHSKNLKYHQNGKNV